MPCEIYRINGEYRPELGLTRALRRGVVGDQIDGRSREGRFLRAAEAELIAQTGGAPSFGQRILDTPRRPRDAALGVARREDGGGVVDRPRRADVRRIMSL